MAARVVLQSWKEISAYVGRTDRTLQRWERKFGFPVHRPAGKSRSAVIAVASEIDEWMRATPLLQEAREAASQTTPVRDHGVSVDEEEKRTEPERMDLTSAEACSGKSYADIAQSLEAHKLRLQAGLERQRELCGEQRALLQQIRSLRQQLKHAKFVGDSATQEHRVVTSRKEK